MTDGSPPRRGPIQVGLVVLAGVGVGAFLAVFVLGVWLLRPSQATRSEPSGPQTTIATDVAATTPVSTGLPHSASPSSVGFMGDDASEPEPVSSPPRAARQAASAFAEAWQLRGSPAQRRAALTPVASPYLVHGLTHVSDALPRGRPQKPQLLSGSSTVARYRVRFATGEAIVITLNLTEHKWLATRVDPAATGERPESDRHDAPAPPAPDPTSP